MTTNTDAVPAGWKLVPVEPTLEMQYAGIDNGAMRPTAAYKAMLAAVPANMAQGAEAQEFKWPPLPMFPESFAHLAGHAYFTEHQMQGYANAYGKAVLASLAPPAQTERALTCGLCGGCGSIVGCEACQSTGNITAPPSQTALTDDARDAALYRWLRDHGFKYADVSLGTDCDGEPFVEFKPRFHIPEPVSMKYDDGEWTASDIDAALTAAQSASVGD